MNVLKDGLESNREPLEITFPESGPDEMTGIIADFSVCYIDGFQRALAVLAVLHYMLLLARLLKQSCGTEACARRACNTAAVLAPISYSFAAPG